MNTLAEYFKIKKMSSAQEIGEYLGTSIDISTPKAFLTSFFNYYIILRTIEKEQEQELWDEYDKVKAKYEAQKRVRETQNKVKLAPTINSENNNASNEARVIQLFPRGYRA